MTTVAKAKCALAVVFLATGCSAGAGSGAGGESAASSSAEALVPAKEWAAIGCSIGHFDGSDVMKCTRASSSSPLAKAVNVDAYSDAYGSFKTSAYLLEITPTEIVYQGDLQGIYDAALKVGPITFAQGVGVQDVMRKTNPPRGRLIAQNVAPCIPDQKGGCWAPPLILSK